MQVLDSESDGSDGSNTEFTGIKVAFATTDMKTVNQHFGSAKSLAIYAINPEMALIQEVMEFGKLAQDGDEDKLSDKIAALCGCVAVYSQALGSSAMQKLIQSGIQPIKIHEGASIPVLIDALQDEMKAGPSAWLAKAIQRDKGVDIYRFDEMEAEGWDE
jgi:nitrogen fixation protein NifX